MKRIVYPPDHGSHKPRSTGKRVCRECHGPATFAEIEYRPIAHLSQDGDMSRSVEPVTTFWCDKHTAITR